MPDGAEYPFIRAFLELSASPPSVVEAEVARARAEAAPATAIYREPDGFITLGHWWTAADIQRPTIRQAVIERAAEIGGGDA